MKINTSRQYSSKSQPHRQSKVYYQSKEWKRKRDQVWKRDNGICQECKDKGIIHQLIRGTKDLSRQGTVDHIKPREAGGTDDLENLRLIGSNHHAAKSNQDKKYYR